LGGDFFESVPTGDLLLLKMILHDWDDDHCVTILRRCREALAPGARLAIVEMLLGKLDAPGLAALMDLNMLVCCPVGGVRRVAAGGWPAAHRGASHGVTAQHHRSRRGLGRMTVRQAPGRLPDRRHRLRHVDHELQRRRRRHYYLGRRVPAMTYLSPTSSRTKSRPCVG
jgi:hypothetical protein